VPGQKVTFADPGGAAASDNTTLTTNVLHFNTDDVVGTDSYVFRPLLFKAEVTLPAVEQLLGKPASTQVSYYDKYLAGGFADPANKIGVYANLVEEATAGVLATKKLGAEFAAEQAGGISTPNLSVSALARAIGPVAGDDLAKVASNAFDPADFFKDFAPTAKLFGSISLIDLLPGGDMDKDAPKVEFSKEPVSATSVKMVANLTWAPKVHDAGVGIVELKTNAATAFLIRGRVERVVQVPPSGSPPAHSTFHGSLTNFTIEFLNVVVVPFKEFSFTSETASKTQVHVDLEGQPDFKGDLAFVNKLREVIPPGLFGDGASLDITLDHVRAGFAIGLPPLSVGVFSLQSLSLGAGLELPFADGLPLFDFNVSSREHPFNLTVAFLGGGGFFHLQLDTQGMRQLEVALEFGASASINLGVASGGVHIMAGVYFAMGKKDGKDYAVLSGYLRLGGELSVLGLISVSLEFNLCFAYEDGKAAGRATLTVKVEVVCFSKSVEISVEKKFGGSSGDPRFVDVFDQPQIWTTYADAFA
jgi:hypothetical protein